MIMNIIMIIDTFNTSMNKYHDYKQRGVNCQVLSTVFTILQYTMIYYRITIQIVQQPSTYLIQ